MNHVAHVVACGNAHRAFARAISFQDVEVCVCRDSGAAEKMDARPQWVASVAGSSAHPPRGEPIR